jgi:lipopolysaccharide/colanic/teichoic acid biosynthesis glycosyltransferase
MNYQTPIKSGTELPAASPAITLPSHRRPFYLTNRFALGGAILLAVLVPELYRPWLVKGAGNLFEDGAYGISVALVGSILAIAFGHISLSRFNALPTLDSKLWIFPAFLMSYGGVLALLYFASVPFGRYPVIISFATTLAWYYSIAINKGRTDNPRMALIGNGHSDALTTLPDVDWLVLKEPVLPAPISALVVDARKDLSPSWEHFVAQAVLNGIPVYDVRQIREALTRRTQIRHMADNHFGALLPALVYIRFKRFADLALTVPASLVFLPLIAVFSLLIRLESKGPAIYRQERTGYRGNVFICYKLRSMREGHNGPLFTDDGDARITRIGAFIRKYRIDELPQIFNIVKGDMSWIGPRPEAVGLAQAYEAAIPFYVYRHAVRPGISGWAAVHQGNVAEVDAATVKLEYDFFYIKHCSFWLDFLIYLMTIRTVLTGFGSR